MDTKEIIRRQREKQRRLFGAIELKMDCVNYCKKKGEDYCHACAKGHGGGKIWLPCEVGVCYFYKPEVQNGD